MQTKTKKNSLHLNSKEKKIFVFEDVNQKKSLQFKLQNEK